MSEDTPLSANAGVRIRCAGYTADAGWFGPEDRPRFGWLYRPDTPAPNGVGVVIVPPFGYEAICAHRTLKHLAENMAGAGFLALRFDLDGTCDSAGSDADPDRVDAWLASIQDACDLASSAGATRLVLAGIRLGATLAMLAATKRNDVAGLIAINAVASGKAFLREGRALQAAMDLEPDPSGALSTGQELIGFEITAETSTALLSVDISRFTTCPAPSLLLIERDDMPARNKLADHLRALGADVTSLRLPGYVDMMRDPMSNIVGQDIIIAAVDFAHRISPSGKQRGDERRRIDFRAHAEIDKGGLEIIEKTLMTNDGMFAIVSQPLAGGSTLGAVLLMTVGALLHVGPNRMYVPLARQLARAGYVVWRVDLSGIGESRARTGAEENVVYGPHAIEDVACWIDAAWAQGATKLICAGVCSGSYHSLHATIRGARVDDLLLVNPAVLRYTKDIPAIAPDTPRIHKVRHYNQSARSKSAWKKLLRGNVAFKAIFDVALWHTSMLIKHYGKEARRRLHLHAHNDLGIQLTSMAQRGTRVHFLFSRAEHGRTLLAIEAGSIVPRLCKAGKFNMTLFDGPDHTFTQRWAQAQLHAAIMGILTGGDPTAKRG